MERPSRTERHAALHGTIPPLPRFLKDVVEGTGVTDEYRAQPDGEHRTPTPEDYRANAADCLRMMQLATVEEVRAALLLMAQSWNQLADRVERTAQTSGVGT
jgi:hypothetical protein